MKARRLETVTLGEFVAALRASAISLLGDHELAYHVIACALADLLGNGTELSKKLEENH